MCVKEEFKNEKSLKKKKKLEDLEKRRLEDEERRKRFDIEKYLLELDIKRGLNKLQKCSVLNDDEELYTGSAVMLFNEDKIKEEGQKKHESKITNSEELTKIYRSLIRVLSRENIGEFRNKFYDYLMREDFDLINLKKYTEQERQKASKGYGSVTNLRPSSTYKSLKIANEKLLNPDEYFKAIICRTLKVPSDQITKNYFKDFLMNRNDNFNKYLEQKEKKEMNFHKTLLKLKKRENIFPSKFKEDAQGLFNQVQTNVAFKFKLAEEKMEQSKLSKLSRSSHMTPRPKTSYHRKEMFPQDGKSTIFITAKSDEKKVDAKNDIASVAEDLQRDILNLENMQMKGQAKFYDGNVKPSLKKGMSAVLDLTKYSSLSNSIIGLSTEKDKSRRIKKIQKKDSSKRSMASKFFY